MKRWLIILVAVIYLIGGYIGCSNNNKGNAEQVLYVLNEVAPIQKAYRTDGDCTIFNDAFKVHWNESGCDISYIYDGEEKHVLFQIGQIKEIELFAVPSNLKYEFFLANDGEELPNTWKEMFAEKEQKQRKKDEIGSFEKYAEMRNREAELTMIETAFKEANLKQDAEIWYQLFLEETWSHGDVSIIITAAKAEKRTTEDSVNLILIDSDGNQFVFYGFANDYIDMVVYKGEIYAGPYTG